MTLFFVITISVGSPLLKIFTPRASALVLWIQDPVKERDPELYSKVLVIENCFQKRGKPIIGSADSLSIGAKHIAFPMLVEAGLPVPRFAQWTMGMGYADIAAKVGSPFIVRENRLHACPMELISNELDFEKWNPDCFEEPIFVEYVNVSAPDGYYRKGRAVVIGGDFAIFRHLIISPRWEVRHEERIENDSTWAEERLFFQTYQHLLPLFIAAAKKLGTPTVTFDFALLTEGHTISGLPFVVWEANPFSCIWADYNELHRQRYGHHLPIVDAIFSAQLKLYLDTADVKSALNTID